MEKKKIYRGGCPACPGNEDVLTMDTVLYMGFGGYKVLKGAKLFYMGDCDLEWEKYKTLKDMEKSYGR